MNNHNMNTNSHSDIVISSPSSCDVLWTLPQLLEALDNARLINQTSDDLDHTKIYGVSIDSRSLKSGDIFIALKGPNFDGHQYCQIALDHGASALLIDDQSSLPAGLLATLHHNVVVIEVPDCYDALLDMARYKRKNVQAIYIAVTGSVGKTSFKSAAMVALSCYGKVHATQGNLNNHIGCPLSLSRMPNDCDYVVLELGMNHQGEIEFLSKIVQPNIAVITNVSAVHSEFFASIYDIALAKSEIMAGMKKDGVLITYREQPFYSVLHDVAMQKAINVITFGRHPNASIRMNHDDQDITKFIVSPHSHLKNSDVALNETTMATLFSVHLPWLGHTRQVNYSAIMALLSSLSLPCDLGMMALAKLTPPKGRGDCIQLPWNIPSVGHIIVINESYNASPISMKAALQHLCEDQKKSSQIQYRKVAILGDMLELGHDSDHFHIQLAKYINGLNLDEVILVGHYMKSCYDHIQGKVKKTYYFKSEDLANNIKNHIKVNDMVLCKASHSIHIDSVITALEHISQAQLA